MRPWSGSSSADWKWCPFWTKCSSSPVCRNRQAIRIMSWTIFSRKIYLKILFRRHLRIPHFLWILCKRISTSNWIKNSCGSAAKISIYSLASWLLSPWFLTTSATSICEITRYSRSKRLRTSSWLTRCTKLRTRNPEIRRDSQILSRIYKWAVTTQSFRKIKTLEITSSEISHIRRVRGMPKTSWTPLWKAPRVSKMIDQWVVHLEEETTSKSSA